MAQFQLPVLGAAETLQVQALLRVLSVTEKRAFRSNFAFEKIPSGMFDDSRLDNDGHLSIVGSVTSFLTAR